MAGNDGFAMGRRQGRDRAPLINTRIDFPHPEEIDLDKLTKIVEVAVTWDGDRTPVGLMSAEQALELPDYIEIEISHPDHEAGATDTFISKGELVEHIISDES